MWAILIACVILFFLYFVANFLYKRTNEYKNTHFESQRFVNGVPQNIKVANFGTTCSEFAFNNYDELGLAGFNFAITCESIEGDFEILKKYSSRFAPNALLFLLCVPPCLSLFRAEMIKHEFDYYRILGHGLWGNKMQCWIKDKFPLAPWNLFRAIRIIKDVPSKDDLVDNYPLITNVNQASKNMDDLAKRWQLLFELNNLTAPTIDTINQQRLQKNIMLFEDMIKYCKEHGFIPLVVFPPFSKYLNRHFSDDFYNATLGKISEMAKTKYNVQVFDYRKTPDFQDDLTMYVDGGFRLSKKGSLIFIKRLLKEINKYGYSVNNKSLRKN